MSTYNDKLKLKTKEEQREPVCSITSAIEEFGISVCGAAEIEFVDLDKMRERNFPMMFYIANLTIDNLLVNLKTKAPHMCPIIIKPEKEKTKARKE